MYTTNSKTRRGFTLLELMIALGLLGALMSVAWSLMATFRDADERGWKITRRTQIIRAAHAWLQNDAQQMLGSPPEFTFTGNSLGFSATIAPSLDPLPFLQRLLSDSSASDKFQSRIAATSQLSSARSPMDGELVEALSDASPWSPKQVQIEYELLPVSQARSINSADTNRSDVNRSLDEVQFMLVRRELIGGVQSSNMQSATQGNSIDFAQEMSPSDRVLTGQDLYRQNEDQQQLRGVPVMQSRLEGLVQPQFQYCDGRSWKDSWNSRSDGGLPAAIALRFDFPARAQMQPPQPRRASEALEDDEFALQDSGGLSAADMALAGEPRAELATDADASLMESDQFEVKMVIMVGGRTAQPTRPVDDFSSRAPLDAVGSSEFASPPSTTGQQANGLRGGF